MLEPREHLVPDPAFDGHFNLLRAYVAPLDVAGVKVVGDYHDNYKLGLPSELALLTLYDPRTGSRARSSTRRRSPSGAPARSPRSAVGTSRARRPRCSPTSARAGPRSPTSRCSTACTTRRDPRHERAARVARGVRRAASRRRSASRSGVRHVEETVRGADVVVEATRLTAPEPILRTEWIAPPPS